jgi:hypothetical protein
MYYENRFLDLKDSMKGTWNLIKNIIGNTGNNVNTGCVDDFLIDGRVTKDNSIIANKFNEYFINVSSNLASKIPSVSGDFRKFVNNNQSISQSFFCYTNRSY